VGDEGATDGAGDQLRVAALLEQAGLNVETGRGEADLLEVGAGDVVDRLGADLVGALSGGVGQVLAGLRLLLGEVEGGGRVEVGELGALGELDAAAGDVDLGQGDQAVAGLGPEQVVDGLGGGAAAAASSSRTSPGPRSTTA